METEEPNSENEPEEQSPTRLEGMETSLTALIRPTRLGLRPALRGWKRAIIITGNAHQLGLRPALRGWKRDNEKTASTKSNMSPTRLEGMETSRNCGTVAETEISLRPALRGWKLGLKKPTPSSERVSDPP